MHLPCWAVAGLVGFVCLLIPPGLAFGWALRWWFGRAG